MNASAKEEITKAEWAVRVDLAALYRLVAPKGWDDMLDTHISGRIPGPEHHFLINPYGMMFEEITASSLIRIYAGGVWQKVYRFETACEIQIKAQSTRATISPIPQNILDQRRAGSTTESLRRRGEFVWSAMIRKLNRIDPGYRA
jgi:ribulose-5-phosphate 4-epimerase/fuculose-1-phosphate aldolase